MKKKLAAMVLCGCMTLQVTAWAAFTDMKDTRWDWARDAIESMTDSGIIKGYDDNTFKPEKSVSKIESLILMARVAGVDEAKNADFVSAALDAYQSELKAYNTTYKREISYLLYKGMLTKDDLPLYVSDSESAVALKRYEAAILLTKLLWNDSLSASSQQTLTFSDAADIPSTAKAYVSYVVSNGIMNGMDGNTFNPMGEVTRAQMATLLYRVMGNFPVTVVRGNAVSYDADKQELKVRDADGVNKGYTLTAKAAVRLDGAAAEADSIWVGADVIINIDTNGTVRLVEALSPEAQQTVTGIFAKYQSASDGVAVYVTDAVTSKTTQYVMADGAAIYKNGSANKTIADLKANDYVTLTLQNGSIIEIRAEDKKQTVSGTVNDIHLLPEYGISVKTGSVVTEYAVDSDVEVKRNGKYTTPADLLVGDTVSLTLTYGIVTSITATSKTQSVNGSIVRIVIDTEDPMITIREKDNTEQEYHLKNTAAITRNESAADVYDLRLGDTATVKIEGSTVVSIAVSAVGENSTIDGVVEYVNSSYGYIKLQGVNELIFVTKAKVTYKDGTTGAVRNIKAGNNITAFCSPSNGSYEATLIVVND